MLKRSLVSIIICVVLLTVYSVPVSKAKSEDLVGKANFEKVVNFQRINEPKIENAIKKKFKKLIKISDTEIAEDVNWDKFKEQATYYWDNSNPDDLKIAFIVNKEDAKDWKEIKKQLQEELGVKVKFKKAKFNPKELEDLVKPVSEYVDTNVSGKKQGVYYDSEFEKVVIQAELTDQEMKDLYKSFNKNMVSIEPIDADFIGTATYKRNYPFTNLGGGMLIGVDNTGNNSPSNPDNYLAASSGYVVYKAGQAYLVTAGHAFEKASTTNTTYEVINGTSPNIQVIGYQHWSGNNATTQYDVGLVRLTANNFYVNSRFYTMNNGGGIDGQLKPALVQSNITKGLAVNKSGYRTGITGGTVTKLDHYAYWSEQSYPTQVIEVTVKAGLGYNINGEQAFAGNNDSGGTVYTASSYALVGSVTAATPQWYDQYGNRYGSRALITPAYAIQKHLGSNTYVYMQTYDTLVGNF
ncbi:hypothetical protein J2W91_004586 [Paenibacillus amylolyticus]|uniref:Serine protease n=1 Tax=Paenibacillus amylolyticus TaxID=1451 RepID=A0AAP5LQV2_PAEAM|nr:hypothetical protein [Paenibacillus amylolyticus]MDR6726080.1 hypothetical protein [Paenibacillus amylolyticus]